MEVKTETYSQMSFRHQKEIDEFPIGAAFSNKQFEEMMQKWGLKATDTKEILSLGAGCYIRKSDEPAFTEMMKRHSREMEEAVKADQAGDGFIFQMFRDELNNHEYGYTGDESDTLEALGLTLEEIENNPALLAGFNKAKEHCA
ncbi:MAG: hypothetical protein K2L82_14105 [Lachnospiraceae bacterium]|nr:hypothetical protein [Lachnospiraceae bacterium]